MESQVFNYEYVCLLYSCHYPLDSDVSESSGNSRSKATLAIPQIPRTIHLAKQ